MFHQVKLKCKSQSMLSLTAINFIVCTKMHSSWCFTPMTERYIGKRLFTSACWQIVFQTEQLRQFPKGLQLPERNEQASGLSRQWICHNMQWIKSTATSGIESTFPLWTVKGEFMLYWQEIYVTKRWITISFCYETTANRVDKKKISLFSPAKFYYHLENHPARYIQCR